MGVGGRVGREVGWGSGSPQAHSPVPACSRSSSPSFLPLPNLLLAAAAAPLTAGEGPGGQLRARLVLGWQREKQGTRTLFGRSPIKVHCCHELWRIRATVAVKWSKAGGLKKWLTYFLTASALSVYRKTQIPLRPPIIPFKTCNQWENVKN